MKNYCEEAKKIKIDINPYFDLNYLKNYRINKERDFVELTYMNGQTIREFLDERTKDNFDQRQRNDLDRIQKEVHEKTSSTISYNSSISIVYALTGTTLLALNNFGGIVWLTWIGYFMSKAAKPMRLRNDVKLALWIYDNKEAVNEIIREEVKSQMEKPNTNVETNNVSEPPYPYTKVIYSKNMYENGIDLNNIEELQNSTLRKLKRKVKTRRRKASK